MRPATEFLDTEQYLEGEMNMMQDLFEFVRTETSPTGATGGILQPTGIRSTYGQRLEIAGYEIDSKPVGTAVR